MTRYERETDGLRRRYPANVVLQYMYLSCSDAVSFSECYTYYWIYSTCKLIKTVDMLNIISYL